MASRAKDLAGLRFGSLVVVRRIATIPGRAKWHCHCDCGQSIDVLAWNLNSGAQHRCGDCANSAKAITQIRHGASRSRLYHVWGDMIQRCSNPRRRNYQHYGGKGVKVCSDWIEFDVFQRWAIGNGYADNLTIDRIDSSGDYEPANCRWITKGENSRLSAVARWKHRERVNV